MASHGLPRLFTLEAEYMLVLMAAELEWVELLVKDIESGSLEGLEDWRGYHAVAEEGTNDRAEPSNQDSS